MAIDYVKLGLRISRARKKAAFSQEAMAEAISTSRNHLSQIEIGSKAPSLDFLVEIANFLEVSADDLLVDSLKRTSSTADTNLHALLHECDENEKALLIEFVKLMKSFLDNHNI